MDFRHLYRDILDGLGASLLVTDPDSLRIVWSNATAENLLRAPAGGLTGRDRAAIRLAREVAPDTPLPWPPSEDRIRDVPVLLARDDATLVPVSWHLMPLRHDGKAFIGEVFFDIAARRVRQLRQGMAKRLEAIGGLAAGIAHEINTPVQYIGDSMTFLTEAGEDMDRLFDLYRELERTAPDTHGLRDVRNRIRRTAAEIDEAFLLEEIPRARARITEGVARITDIVLAMKRFAHPGGEEKRLVDVNRALEDTVTVTRNEWKYAARLETDLDPGLPLVPAHAGDLSQVFLNLVVNAAQAVAEAVGDSGEKGVIRVKTRLSGDRAVVCVSDTGPGVPQALQETIFDPFFTTKEVGKGTGQGLALVHDIVVNKHGGTVRLESSPGQGAAFTVELPLVARETHPETP